MIPKKWHIRLDMQKQYDNEIIEMVRQDTYSNELMIHLVQNGSVVDFTDTVLVAIIFDKSDGSQVIGSCEILQNGLVRYIVDYQALTSLGITTVTLKLVDSDMVETSTSFIINVIADPFFGTDGSIVSTSEYPILTNLLANFSTLDVNLEIIQGWVDDPSQFIGATGPIGPIGQTGIQGIQGIEGIQGIQGIQGEKGERGADAVLTDIDGQYAFKIVNGDLYLLYPDDAAAPNYSIDVNGNLILDLGEVI